MTQPLLPLVYQLDKTATNSNNLVLNEIHNLSTMKRRCIAPIHAPFYSDGVVIRDVSNSNRILQPNEYGFFLLQAIPTSVIGKEVYGIIVIENPLVSSQVSVDYQTVGGEYSRTYAATKEMIDILLNDNRPSTWPNVIDRPAFFSPVAHLHELGDSIGYEYILAQLERLRQILLLRNDLLIENLLKYLDLKTKGSNDRIAQNTASILQLFQTTNNLNDQYINIQDQFRQINENLADSNLRAAAAIAEYQNAVLEALTPPVTPDP